MSGICGLLVSAMVSVTSNHRAVPVSQRPFCRSCCEEEGLRSGHRQRLQNPALWPRLFSQTPAGPLPSFPAGKTEGTRRSGHRPCRSARLRLLPLFGTGPGTGFDARHLRGAIALGRPLPHRRQPSHLCHSFSHPPKHTHNAVSAA